jgi:putative RNA 2'-phosphotransferase
VRPRLHMEVHHSVRSIMGDLLMTSDNYASDIVIAVSRVLSKVLRHEPELVGIRLDENGWVDVQELLNKLDRARRSSGAPRRIRALPHVTHDLLREVVAKNDKGRFTFSDDERRIRAVQGHSVSVNLEYPVAVPPETLFHGTAAANWPAISAQGLDRGARHAVHLSINADTARRVGARHGRPAVLEVQAGQMHRDGHQFSCADNGVWLVLFVPALHQPDSRLVTP